MMSVKYVLRDCFPPLLLRGIQRLLGSSIRFEGDYSSWDAARQDATGYDADLILTRVRDATLKVKRGEAAFERDSVVFERAEYFWPVLAGLMWAAARNQGRLNVLDFGGALGSTYFQHRRFLHSLADVQWNVVEQAHYVACGNAEISDETLQFYPDIASCLSEHSPNVVLLSSVLQYLPDPFALLDEVAEVGASVMLIARTPIADTPNNRILVQHVPASIYPASYPMWVFSESLLLDRIKWHWRFVARFDGPEGEIRPSIGRPFRFEGWLLEAS